MLLCSLAGPAPRAALLAALVAGAGASGVAHGQPPQTGDGPQPTLVGFAQRELERLQASSERVTPENISRYFATYPLPTDSSEAQRLLGTSLRILSGFAEQLYRAADRAARARGAAEIDGALMQALIDERLPRQATELKSVRFFPAAPVAVAVETIDLEAFRDTPFPWTALLSLQGLAAAGEVLPLTEQAVERFAGAVSDCGLLLFRMGGALARHEYARELASPHLRQAEKAIADRTGGVAGVGAPPAVGTPFVDVTAASGIRFHHLSSDWISRFRRYGPFAPTFSGGGVAAGDLDGDGWPDLVFCGGEGCAAFRNRRDGRFEDVTGAAGLAVAGEARMPLIVDFDNDGDRDLFITYARDTNRLFENLDGLRFRDVTAAAGLAAEGDISGPAIAFDYDNDGLLDIYVGNFGDYLAADTPWRELDNQNAQPNRLYRNLGRLVFRDVSESAGEVGNRGWAQAISHVDYDGDGDQDVYIANDFGTNDLLENQGDGTFRSRGRSSGTDDPFHGMNVAFSDLNRDGHADIFLTNIWGWLLSEPEPGEYNKMLLSQASPPDPPVYTADRATIPELISHDTGWSWAGLFFDADNDGDDDLFTVNGHSDYSTFLQYRHHPTREGEIYPINNGREKNLFFRNQGGTLELADRPHGAELGELNSRSIALLDFDRDGDLDLAISTFHAPAYLFRNDAPAPGSHWLVVELVGDPERGTSRDALGARLVARGGDGLYVWRTVTGGEGYLGMSTPEVELGLGTAREVDLEVLWPGGERQRLPAVAGDRRIRVRQGIAGYELLAPGPGGGAGQRSP